jgi:hypothetical protein
MTIVRKTSRTKSKKYRPNLWFEKIMAFIAVINLVLVIFNLTYIPLRDFWYSGQVRLGNIKSAYITFEGIELDLIPENISQFIVRYDAFKGIVPQRDTETYLATVDRLETELANNNNNLESATVNDILGDLRRHSIEIIQSNPFAEANKIGNLERIKNRIRERIPNQDNSAKQALWQFWTPGYLKNNLEEELAFFDTKIRPLIDANYYRYIDENGSYVDYFGFIDFPFGALFALEFLARTWYISKGRTGVSWFDAMLWRWYDLIFLVPFWRWLRVIPVTIRLSQANLIDLHSIQKQISQGFVAGIAEDITEVVVIRIINQMQTSIRQGDINKILSIQKTNAYVDINNTNETAEIIRILAKVIVDRVLPEIQPEAEVLLKYSIEKVLKQSSAYQGIRLLPGGDRLIVNLSQQLVSQSYQAFSSALQAILEDDEQFDRLVESLVNNLTKSFASELQAKQSLNKIEFLLVDLLEEVKINYVERLSEEDVEEILEETRSIRNISR